MIKLIFFNRFPGVGISDKATASAYSEGKIICDVFVSSCLLAYEVYRLFNTFLADTEQLCYAWHFHLITLLQDQEIRV